MTLPIDLVLVRHGESEGNAAKRLSEKGDHSAFTNEFLNRHSSGFHLTAKGCEQAQQAGACIRSMFSQDGRYFDRYITSEYLRARETAGLLGISGALWYTDFYLRERDWGELDVCPESEKNERYRRSLALKETEPFYWKPPNGESFAELCLRVDRVLDTLHRECSNKRVLIVCHGEVMRAFRVRIERQTQAVFKQSILSKNSMDRIYNCEIIHYTRLNPSDGSLASHLEWMRKIRPTNTPYTVTEWRRIKRSLVSNSELLSSLPEKHMMLLA